MATTKKKIRVQIVERLESTFADLKEQMGKRSFKRNISKAAKALTRDVKPLKKSPEKKEVQAVAGKAGGT